MTPKKEFDAGKLPELASSLSKRGYLVIAPIMDEGRVVGAGTPASLKGDGKDNMRLELVLEPRAETPRLPEFLHHTVVTGRRVIGRVEEQDVAPIIQWARDLKEQNVVEEYAVGPITLEEVYLSTVGHGDAQELEGEEADHESVVA